jgi:hypothetical protein
VATNVRQVGNGFTKSDFGSIGPTTDDTAHGASRQQQILLSAAIRVVARRRQSSDGPSRNDVGQNQVAA